MADVKGLLSDPDFQKLDPATQKSTLGKLDPEFSSLTDDQFNQFKSKLSPRHGASGSWAKGMPSNAEKTEIDKGFKGGPVFYGGDIVGGIQKAIASGTVRKFVADFAAKTVASVAGAAAARQGAKAIGAPEWVADLAAVAGGVTGVKAESWIESALGKESFDKLAYGAYKEKYGRDPATPTEKLTARGEARKIANDAARQAKPAAEPKTPKPTKEDLAKQDYESHLAKQQGARSSLPGPATPKPGETGTGNSPSAGVNPALKQPKPTGTRNRSTGSNPDELSESDRRMIDTPSTPPPAAAPPDTPKTGTGNAPGSGVNPALKTPKPQGFRNRPAGPGTFSPATPVPGAASTVDGSKVKEAAEMVKSLGATPESLKSAPQSQWDAIGKQLGHPVTDEFKQAVIDEIGGGKTAAKPSPKAADAMGSGPKTPKPSPGGERVESTVTPEARATRAEDHATKLAAKIRKTLPADKIPELTDDAGWKVLESQTGTEATPAVRKAAIDKARKLWSEGPRSAGDLQKRRAEYFAKKSKP
jgi:hypothetical protein